MLLGHVGEARDEGNVVDPSRKLTLTHIITTDDAENVQKPRRSTKHHQIQASISKDLDDIDHASGGNAILPQHIARMNIPKTQASRPVRTAHQRISPIKRRDRMGMTAKSRHTFGLG